MLRRALEYQMFEQVRHPGLAVIFVTRADQVGHVNGDRLFGRVGKEQDAQAVGQTVLGDALDRGYALGILRLRRDDEDGTGERQRAARP